MKKQVIYASAVAAAILVGFTGAAISTEMMAEARDTETAKTEATAILAAEAENNNGIKLTSPKFDKNETVYAITDARGTVKSKFIGSTLYTGEAELPVGLGIQYYLDGVEMSAEEIAGKAGRVKIVFKYSSLETRMGKKVPFVAITGLNLDGTKFNNVKITNGKIISQNDDYVMAGYGLPGMNEDLGTDFLPEGFTVEADTTGFMLGTTYTLLTNDIIADIDVTGLNKVDGLINSVNQLNAGMEQLVAGSQDLANGATSLYNGMKKIQTGATTLANKAGQLADGATNLAGGLNELVNFNNGVIAKIDDTTDTVTATMQELVEKYGKNISPELLDKINTIVSEYYNTAYTAVTTYAGNIEKLADGASQIAAGADALTDGAWQLAGGINQVTNGAEQLVNGSNTLHDGLVTFKASGVDKLVNFANKDLNNFTRSLRETVAAAGMYRNFDSSSAETVRFIVKTASVK